MIREISSQEVASVFELMRQLRPHLSLQSFIDIYQQAHNADRYTLYGYYEDENCIALMGLRYLQDYVHGHHLYIDDLVVDSAIRSKGIGAKLLKFAEVLAKDNKCSGLRLCTGVDNKDGIRFYERENWNFRAVVYKKKI